MKKKKTQFDLLYENATQASGDNNLRMGQQQTMDPQRVSVSLVDFINQQNKVKKQLQQSPNVLPYPMTETTNDQLGQLYVDTQHLKKVFDAAREQIRLTKNRHNSNTMSRINKGFEDILNEIRRISTEIERLKVDN